MRSSVPVLLAFIGDLAGCGSAQPVVPPGPPVPSDGGVPDAGLRDAGMPDAGALDGGLPDAGTSDAGVGDAGASDWTWRSVPIGGGGYVTGIVVQPTSGTVYARTDIGGAYRWDPAQTRWVPLLDWLPGGRNGWDGVASFAISPSDPNALALLVGRGDPMVFASEDRGATMRQALSASDAVSHWPGDAVDGSSRDGRWGGERLALAQDGTLWVATRGQGLWKGVPSADAWSWSRASIPVPSTATVRALALASDGTLYAAIQDDAVSATDPGLAVAVAFGGKPLRREPSTGVWAPIEALQPDDSSYQGMYQKDRPLAADGKDGNTFYLYDRARLWVSTDGAKTFSETSASLPSSSLSSVAAPPGIAGEVWVGLDTHGLYRFTNGGTDVQKISGVTRAEAVAFGAALPETSRPALFLVGEAGAGFGVYVSSTVPPSWRKISTAATPLALFRSLSASPDVPGRVFLGLSGRGVFYGDLR